eukprot:19731-Heterococcus_DN1.PRE.2
MNQPAVLTTNTNNKTQQQQQQQQQQQHTPQPLQQHQRCYYTATASTAALAAVACCIHAEDFTPAQMCELPLDNYPDLKPVPAWEASHSYFELRHCIALLQRLQSVLISALHCSCNASSMCATRVKQLAAASV